MSSGTWMNKDGLYLEFGTTKPTVEAAGEYRSPGTNRIIEVVFDLAGLSTSAAAPTIIANTTRFPGGIVQVEEVQIFVETVPTGTGALSIGLMQDDRVTVIDAAAFVSAAALTTFDAIGEWQSLHVGSAGAGTLIGVKPTTALNAGYITAFTGAAGYTTGRLRVRIFYHGYGSITQ